MGAPALAPRRAPAPGRAPKRAPARRRRKAGAGTARAGAARTAPRRVSTRPVAPRPNPALAGAAMIPHAAVRTAGAVRDISDSSFIVRLTAGRAWIAVLCALLGGIVALNVVSLSINATSGRVSQAIDEYERQNSSLRGELAQELSAGKVQEAAAALGYAVPGPEDITYLDAHDGDLDSLAKALTETPLSTSSDDFSTDTGYTAPTEASSTGTTVPSVSTPSAPATSTPTPSAPAPAAPSPAPSSGGGATGGVGL